MKTIKQSEERSVVTLSLNRPANHNAFTPRMVSELTSTILGLGNRRDVRVIVLTGLGRSFCAGADLASMRGAADYSYDQNVADGRAIYALMWALDSCPKPLVGRINGAAIGGGAGLVSCCDISVAVTGAKFAFSESRLGLVPAVISPFVVSKIGESFARELFLTGERFDAHHALRIGLVHQVVEQTDLDDVVRTCVKRLLKAAPGAQGEIKELLRTLRLPLAEPGDYTSILIARRRASKEGREGMTAFLEKRKPRWQDDFEV